MLSLSSSPFPYLVRTLPSHPVRTRTYVCKYTYIHCGLDPAAHIWTDQTTLFSRSARARPNSVRQKKSRAIFLSTVVWTWMKPMHITWMSWRPACRNVQRRSEASFILVCMRFLSFVCRIKLSNIDNIHLNLLTRTLLSCSYAK